MRRHRDRRFTVRREWCGYPRQRWVARFCGSWLGSFATRREAVARCRLHHPDINPAG